jgi:MFS family permease
MKKRLGPEEWAVIRLALVAAFGEAGYAVVNMLALPMLVSKTLHATLSLGWIYGSFMLAEALFKGPMGAISDRVGRRAILMLAPLGSASAAFALTLVRAPLTSGKLHYMEGVRCLDGIAAAALWTTMYAAVADQVPEERRARAMSTLTVSYLAGVAAGPALGGWAYKEISVRAPFYLVAVLFLLASLTATFLAPHAATHHPSHPERGEAAIVVGFVESLRLSVAGFIESLRRAPQFMLIAMAVFLAVGLLIPTAPLLALDAFHLNPKEYGLLFILTAPVIGVLTVPLARLGERWGAARSVHAGMATAALALWALTFLPKTEVLLVVGASALGIGFVIGTPAWMAIVSGLGDPKHTGAMIGAVATAQGVGALFGVVIGPLLYKSRLMARWLDWLWPWRSLPPHLLPVICAAILLTATWFASLAVVRGRPQVSAEA